MFERKGFGFEKTPIGLREKYGEPMFSILDTRSGNWQARKKKWISLGIQSELGRKDKLLGYSEKLAKIKGGYHNKDGSLKHTFNRSVFDPVLCELMYNWFCPINGTILDPFAGGSVRGIVGNFLNRKYTGIELREEQVESNNQQAKQIFSKDNIPKWICGDSKNISHLIEKNYDFLFTCPPYGNLEVYSDDPRDLSNMKWEDFIENYFKIIKESCDKIKNDRFSTIVVGDFRDKKGFYRKFPFYTIQAFEEAGMFLYNEAILITIPGTVAITVPKYFKNRKLGKTHQNILIFYKGDPKNIQNNFKGDK